MTRDWKAPDVAMQRSSFDRSKGHKTTFDVDNLVPIYLDEVLPGDTVNMGMSAFARLSTPIYPIMDNMAMTVHWFFVPLRLVWDNAEKFFGEDIVGGDGNAPAKPIRTSNPTAGIAAETLQDYMGLPVTIPGLQYDELPLRAYYVIYNEWYRDQNLQEKIEVDLGDQINDWSILPGANLDDVPLLKRNKRHDYFTSSLPWPQKGPDISLPIVNPFAPIAQLNDYVWKNAATEADGQQGLRMIGDGAGDKWRSNTSDPAFMDGPAVPNADAWNDNSGTINQLRFAFAVQKYYEKDARGGTRYPEVLKSHFGVTSPDARLQRPEYLGANRTKVNVTPVAATFEEDGGSNSRTVGDLGAMGTVSIGGQSSFVKSFVEHGYILGILSVTADLTYQQGLHRLWHRDTRFEYYWPSFAGLGEQPVETQEIWAGDATGAIGRQKIWGYQERYSEYRHAQSCISGLFRSYVPGTLHAWHLSQQFTEEPFLNDQFIQSNTPLGRALAVPTEPDFIGDFYFHTKWARAMPLYGIPGNVDRF